MKLFRGDRVSWPNARDGERRYGVVMGTVKPCTYTQAYGPHTWVAPTSKPDQDVPDLPATDSGLGVMVCRKDLTLISRAGDPPSPHKWARFQHDCPRCTFLGHYAGHDVYSCPSIAPGRLSLLARYGNEGREYYSTDAASMKTSIEQNLRVRDCTVKPSVIREAQPMPYQLAIIMALAHAHLSPKGDEVA